MKKGTSDSVNRRSFLKLAGMSVGGFTALAGSFGAARRVAAAPSSSAIVPPEAVPASKRNFKVIDWSINAWFPGVGERFADIGYRDLGVCNRTDVGWPFPGSTNRREECIRGWTPEYMLERMDMAGVEKGGLISSWAAVGVGGKDCRVEADEVHAVVNKYPDRFFGIVGVSPLPGSWSQYYPRTYIKRAVKDFGFKAVHMYPHWFGVKINDKKMYPIYETALELDVPVLFQVGEGTFMSGARIVALPEWIDDMARDFPSLKLIGIHPGGSWRDDFVSMLRKERNVYWGLDSGGAAPRLWPEFGVVDLFKQDRGPGYRAQHQNPVDKIMWGSDFPSQEWVHSLNQFDALGLPEEVARKVARDNAIRIFKL
jgi:predicted TIM-barrel fold metal-dependent hydrolase